MAGEFSRIDLFEIVHKQGGIVVKMKAGGAGEIVVFKPALQQLVHELENAAVHVNNVPLIGAPVDFEDPDRLFKKAE